jgi:hypothetical protein
MGLALAAQKTIGIVGIAFGVAASLFDTTTGTVLYQLPAASVSSVVQAQRQVLRGDEDPAKPSPAWRAIDNQAAAAARINEYVQYCSPVTIEANIARVLSNTRAGNNQDLVSTPAPAAASSGQDLVRTEPPGAWVAPAVARTDGAPNPKTPVAAAPPLASGVSIGGALSFDENSLLRQQGRTIQAALCLPQPLQNGDFGPETRDAIASWRSSLRVSALSVSSPLSSSEIRFLLAQRACPPIYRSAFERFSYPTPALILRLQQALNKVVGGTPLVPENMKLDEDTRKGIAALQQKKGLTPTGTMTRDLADSLNQG